MHLHCICSCVVWCQIFPVKQRFFFRLLFCFWFAHMYWSMGTKRLCICLIGKHSRFRLVPCQSQSNKLPQGCCIFNEQQNNLQMSWEDLGWKLYRIGKATKKKPQKHWRKCLAVSDLKGSNYLVYQKGVTQELGEPLI